MEFLAAYGFSQDEPLYLVPGQPVDQLAIPSGLDQDRLEDMQVWAFLSDLTAAGGRHPLAVEVGEDPPDRYLGTSDYRWGIELTELTSTQVRAELAQIRAFGRQLERQLQEDDLPHLTGRRVVLSTHDKGSVSNSPDLIAAIRRALKEDKGCVGEGYGDEGVPLQLPTHGMYGVLGPFVMQVYEDSSAPGVISVTASVQAQFRHAEVVEALQERINRKDNPPNDLLLISCGLPDPAGYICPLDVFLFAQIFEQTQEIQEALAEPEHLKAVVVHSPRANAFVELFRRPGSSVPWDAAG
jgi:hypothetical protein